MVINSIEKKSLNREVASSGFSIACLSPNIKRFLSLMLFVAALCYVTLIFSIWNDTALRISNIIEGYGDMGNIELVGHTLQYMYWFFGIFFMTVSLFLIGSNDEKVKAIFAHGVPVLIITDIGSAWLIRYHDLFAYTLFGSGILLALSFSFMFFWIQMDLLFKTKRRS